MSLCARFLTASLSSSAVTSFLSSATKSTTETSGVGTRKAIPFIFPFSSGITRPIALAAPVDVGTIERAAARPR